MVKTPIALILFRRPQLTARVLQTIIAAQPSQLYVIADGPRNADDVAACQQTRQLVEQYKNSCDIKMNLASVNLGLNDRIISGLDWVFTQEERAIILEDDWLPHPTFFRFCDELLEFYEHDAHVMHISGGNFLRKRWSIRDSYYFTKYAHVSGWATWKRAWKYYHEWDNDINGLIINPHIFRTKRERTFWKEKKNQLIMKKKKVSWDYQWTLICMARKALCINPRINLVTNIGYGKGATNTETITWLANMPVAAMNFPLTHPTEKKWDEKADQITGTIFYDASEAISYRMKVLLFRLWTLIRSGN